MVQEQCYTVDRCELQRGEYSEMGYRKVVGFGDGWSGGWFGVYIR